MDETGLSQQRALIMAQRQDVVADASDAWSETDLDDLRHASLLYAALTWQGDDQDDETRLVSNVFLAGV